MKKLLVKDAEVNVDEGGIACGPVCGPIGAEVKLTDEAGKEIFLTLVEVDGLPHLYKADKSTLKYHSSKIYDEMEEEEVYKIFKELNEKCWIPYENYREMLDDKEDDLYDAIRYLVYLVRCGLDEEKPFIDKTLGKYLDEIDIPVSDIEEDYIEDLE